MRHRTAYDSEFREATAAAVIPMQSRVWTVIVLSRPAPYAASAGLNRFDRDPLTRGQVVDSAAHRHHFATQLVTQNHWIFHAGKRMRCRARGDRPVVVLEQIAAASRMLLPFHGLLRRFGGSVASGER